MVKYVYDAWGNHLVPDANGQPITDANHIGNLNPFRYRGYYYDRETGLYYLKSRYYDPVEGVNKLIEVVSPKQSTNYIVNKMSNMLSNNPETVGKIIVWVRRLFR